MSLKKTEKALVQLGQYLQIHLAHPDEEFDTVLKKAEQQNPWFTIKNQLFALKQWSISLQEENLNAWIKSYPNRSQNSCKIALVMAGNLPLVGFHDLVCVLVSGSVAVVKPSSKDETLMLFVIEKLKQFTPELEERILIEKNILKNFDAVIATGSNNSARYFEFYFQHKPHIIRKGRSSAAILDGKETPEELQGLAHDIFGYFGLGCRNVSKLYVPKNYDFTALFETFKSYAYLADHFKYSNNYLYHKSVFLLNGDQFIDGDFYLLKSSEAIASPLSVIFYEYYTQRSEVQTHLATLKDHLQCLVGSHASNGEIPFGSTQTPALDQYADHINTLDFLEKITNKNLLF